MTFAIALLAAGSVFFTAWHLLDVHGLKPENRIDSGTLFDLVKLSFGVVAGAGALVALVVAYRRQRVDEDGALREAMRLHTERFTTAVSQLGDASAAVRLGGVHALTGLADDAPTQALRQTCVDVLCAYLHLPHTPDPGTSSEHRDEHHRYLALRTVRHTILRLIGDHYRRPADTYGSWQGSDLDLCGITLDGPMNFQEADFSGGRVDFSNATFSEGTVDFSNARFSGGTVDFSNASFSGATVTLRRASFSGGLVHFLGAAFLGGSVHFDDAAFIDGAVFFSGAAFCGATVDFGDTAFLGGVVHFGSATFSGGTMDFSDAAFLGGTVDFSYATFLGGTVDFARAQGTAPRHLVPPVGTPLAPGLTLPASWLP
ncbi:pentapeptide repeat-containing protein [Streptomyces sp. NPDC051214]|uniref:pentapeptide repeat-containing protein n=1 Tax=Streptomyces sp. NPDC051214 TaxID=3155282 RepID=UPI0034473B79